MTVLQWERSLVVGRHADGVQLLGRGASSVLRGKGLYAAALWLQSAFANPTTETDVIDRVPDSQKAAVQSLISSLVKCGALHELRVLPHGEHPTKINLGLKSNLPRDHPLLLAAEEAARILNSCPSRLTNSREIAVSAMWEDASNDERASYSVIADARGLWLLPPGVAKEDLASRKSIFDESVSTQYSAAGLVPLMLVATGDHRPHIEATFFDGGTRELSRHLLLPVSADVLGQTIEEDQNITFSALSARVCDDLVGPIGRPREGALRQLPLQVSMVRLGGAHSTSVVLGTGMTLEDARVDAVRRGLLWHSILASIDGPAVSGSMLSLTGQDREGVILDPERVRAYVDRHMNQAVFVGQPPGFAHESSKDGAFAAAASSLLMAEHPKVHQACQGFQITPYRSQEIDFLELFSGNRVDMYQVSCAPTPTIAVAVSSTEAVYSSAATLSEAIERGVRHALVHTQSKIPGNEAIRIETRALPKTVTASLHRTEPLEVTDILHLLLEGGEVVQLNLAEDPSVKRLFPNQIGLVRL